MTNRHAEYYLEHRTSDVGICTKECGGRIELQRQDFVIVATARRPSAHLMLSGLLKKYSRLPNALAAY